MPLKTGMRSDLRFFRAIRESGSNATPSMLAQLEREALKSQDYDLLIRELEAQIRTQ